MDWKDKIGNQTFWTLLAGIITSLLVLFNVEEVPTANIVGVVGAVGTMACFVLADAYVEVKRLKESNGDQVDEIKKEVLEVIQDDMVEEMIRELKK